MKTPPPQPPPHSSHPPIALAQLDAGQRRRRFGAVRGVLSDIDDTLTRDGAIEPQALAALHALRAAALPVVAVTGRGMGWCEAFLRPGAPWPVEAIVAENGAVALIAQRGAPPLLEYAQDDATRARNARRLRHAAARVLREVPGARLAADSAGRITDIAIDHAEHARLDAAQVARVVALLRDEGAQASVSSIHVNAWFGEHDKWRGAQWIVRRLYGRALADEVGDWVYVGDSTNDQLMFRHFPLSVGVANLLAFAGQLQDWPRYIAAGERGAGFAEVAQLLLQARAAAGR